MNNESQAERRAELEAEAAELQAEADAIEATIPDEWADAYATFNALVQAEQRARNTYRRAADGSVEPVMELMSVLGSNAAFAELEDRLRGMEEIILNATPEEAEAALDGLGSAFNDVQGASGIASALSSARRDISRGRTDDALEEWREAIEEYDEQASWRGPAADALAPGLASYLDTISDTIGARQQPELSRDQALYLASCNSHHRDLSLNF